MFLVNTEFFRLLFAHRLQVGEYRPKIAVLDIFHERDQSDRGFINLFAVHICNRFLRQVGCCMFMSSHKRDNAIYSFGEQITRAKGIYAPPRIFFQLLKIAGIGW